MPGVSIGNNCIIGCGAIVTKSIPDNSVAVGVPARVIESIEEYEVKNADKFMYTKGMSREEKAKYLQENLVEISK
jgi:serine acetyltransferase